MGTSLTVTLRKSPARINPQDLSAITAVVGTSSRGTVDTMQTITQQSTLRSTQGGYSPACSTVAELLGVGGAPVYFARSTTDNVGVVAAVVKTPISAGVAYNVYGYALLDGADVNGDIGFQALAADVSLTVAVGGALAATVVGTDVTLTITAATASSAVETFWLGADPGATAARALITATFYGTKASNAGTSLAQVFFNNGGISYTPPETGYTFKLTVGAAQALTSTYATNALTVNLACNADSQSNGTATLTIAAINAALAVPTNGRIVAAPIGNGTGRPGFAPSTFTALQFGSTSAMTLSGDPVDYMPNIHVLCSTGGALGMAQIRWTIDGQAGQVTASGATASNTLSAPVLVPGSGIVTLTVPNFESGLTATFTGVLEAGDYWDSSATAPTSNIASLLSAATAMLDDPDRQFGVLTCAQPLTLSEVVQMDNLIQTKWGTKFVEGIFPIRDRTISGGAYTETDADYVVALKAEFISFSSSHGLTDLVPAGCVFVDGYTGYTYGLPNFAGEVVAARPSIIPAIARNSAIPVHESLGRVATGAIRNVIGITHDERTAPGLFDKYIPTQTYDQRPGEYYFSGASTTGDPSDPSYTREPWVSLACAVARIAAEAAFIYTGDTVDTIAVAESPAVPAGAFTIAQALSIEATVAAPIEDFLFRPKTDGRPSADRLPATDSSGAPLKTCTVARNYSAKDTKQIRLEVVFARKGIIESIDIGINLL